jgi:signal peptidase II
VKRIHYLALAIVIVVLDALTKWLVVSRIDLHEAVPLVPDLFQLVHVRQVGLHLILGGAIGNLVDRFRFRYVVDFLDFYVSLGGREHHWPAFNVADSAICVGIALLFFDMRRKPDEATAATESAT